MAFIICINYDSISPANLLMDEGTGQVQIFNTLSDIPEKYLGGDNYLAVELSDTWTIENVKALLNDAWQAGFNFAVHKIKNFTGIEHSKKDELSKKYVESIFQGI